MYHMIYDNNNLLKFINKKNIKPFKEKELIDLENEIYNLNNKIDIFDKKIDEDLLDEEIKKNILFLRKNELVINSDELNGEIN